jgi:hypothetical protein
MPKALGASMLVLLGSVAIAAAQSPSGVAEDNASGTPNLSPTQRQTITRGLSGEHTQSLEAASQAQVGSKMLNSLTAQPMPKNVGDQVPEVKSYLFVRLPDRIIAPLLRRWLWKMAGSSDWGASSCGAIC